MPYKMVATNNGPPVVVDIEGSTIGAPIPMWSKGTVLMRSDDRIPIPTPGAERREREAITYAQSLPPKGEQTEKTFMASNGQEYTALLSVYQEGCMSFKMSPLPPHQILKILYAIRDGTKRVEC